MGLFDFAFGSNDSSTSTQSTEDSKTDITKKTAGSSTRTGSESSVGSSEQTVTSLDAETQSLLASLLQQIGGASGTASQDLQAVAKSLVERSQETDAVLRDNINAIMAEASRSGQKEIQTLNTQLASSVGSKNNTFVTGATAEAQAQLASQLAAKEGELNIAAREAGSRDIQAAIEAFSGVQSQQSGALAALANVLKGSTTTSVATNVQDTQTSEALKSLESIVQAITSLTNRSGTSDTEASSMQFGLSL